MVQTYHACFDPWRHSPSLQLPSWPDSDEFAKGNHQGNSKFQNGCISLWKVPANRDSLVEKLEKNDFNKDHPLAFIDYDPISKHTAFQHMVMLQNRQEEFLKTLTVERERSNQKKLKTQKGWYTESEMKDDLCWKPKHGLNICWKSCQNMLPYVGCLASSFNYKWRLRFPRERIKGATMQCRKHGLVRLGIVGCDWNKSTIFNRPSWFQFEMIEAKQIWPDRRVLGGSPHDRICGIQWESVWERITRSKFKWGRPFAAFHKSCLNMLTPFFAHRFACSVVLP